MKSIHAYPNNTKSALLNYIMFALTDCNLIFIEMYFPAIASGLDRILFGLEAINGLRKYYYKTIKIYL